MSCLDVHSLLDGLRHARHEAIMSYNSAIEGEEAGHLLNCLLDVELAIVHLERSRDPNAERRAAERIRDDAARIQCEAEALMQEDDDLEPSVGDVVEEPEPSGKDDPVELARAMQRKRHGGST